MELQLRDYQTECLDAISAAAKANIWKALVSLPTGTGKTIIFAHMVRQVAQRGGRSLILVHRDELLNRELFDTLHEIKVLLEQWRREYNTIRPHSSLGYRPPAPEVLMWPQDSLLTGALHPAQRLAEHPL